MMMSRLRHKSLFSIFAAVLAIVLSSCAAPEDALLTDMWEFDLQYGFVCSIEPNYQSCQELRDQFFDLATESDDWDDSPHVLLARQYLGAIQMHAVTDRLLSSHKDRISTIFESNDRCQEAWVFPDDSSWPICEDDRRLLHESGIGIDNYLDTERAYSLAWSAYIRESSELDYLIDGFDIRTDYLNKRIELNPETPLDSGWATVEAETPIRIP
jgi:hypothetical protein